MKSEVLIINIRTSGSPLVRLTYRSGHKIFKERDGFLSPAFFSRTPPGSEF